MHEGVPAPQFDRRGFLTGILAGAVVVATAGAATAEGGGSEHVVAAPDMELAAREQPAPDPSTQTGADLAKTNAETEKLREEAAAVREKAELDRRREAAEVDKLQQETAYNRSNRKFFLDLSPYATILVTAVGGLWAYLKHRRESSAEREKGRQERIDKEQAEAETRLGDVTKRLLTGDDPSGWEGADVDLLAFTGKAHRALHERVFTVAAAKLRTRASLTTSTEPPYTHLVTAMLQVAPGLRAAAESERITAVYPYPYREMLGDTETVVLNEPVLDARGVMLDGLPLMGADLSLFNLREASLSRAHMHTAVMHGGSLDDVDCVEALMQGAVISRVSCSRWNVLDAVLDGSRFIELDYSEMDILAAASVRGMVIDGTKGLDSNTIEELRRRGAQVLERDNYGLPGTSPGDDQTAPGDQ